MNEKVKKEHKSIGTYYITMLKNGKKTYKKQLKLGVDAMTGKEIITTVSGKSFEELKLKIERKKREFADNGKTVKPKPKIRTFAELCEDWYEEYAPTVKPNTVRRIRGMLDNYLIPDLGDYLLEKISPFLIKQTVEQWATKARIVTDHKNRGKGCCKDYPTRLSYVKKIFGHAMTLELVVRNPADRIKAPRLNADETKKKVIKFYEKDELKYFLEGITVSSEGSTFDFYRQTFYGVYFHFLAHTGARCNEALALYWDDLDFEALSVHISKTYDNLHQLQLTTKSEKSTRTLSLDSGTVDKLKNWKSFQQRIRQDHNLPEAKFVFESLESQAGIHCSVPRKFSEIHAARVDLPYIGLHGFRHTHASLLLDAGIDFKQIQERLGHEKIHITMDTYGHLSKRKTQQIANVLADYMSW